MIRRSGIYQIVNSENGKRYVGSTVCFRTRFNTHRLQLNKGAHHSSYLQRAWDKYGPDAFKFQIVMICAPEDNIFFEQRAMDAFESTNDLLGYNVAPAAGSQLGFKHSDKSKKAMSVGRTGLKRTEAQKIGQSRAQRQRTDVKTHHFDGRDQTVLQWAEELGWIKDVLARRISEMGVEEALTRPHCMVDEDYRLTAEFEGETSTLMDLSKKYDVNYGMLKNRVRRGWPIAKALSIPIGVGYDNRRSTRSYRLKVAVKHEYGGMSKSVTEWAQHLGISRDTLAYRIGPLKWDITRALSTPARSKKEAVCQQ